MCVSHSLLSLRSSSLGPRDVIVFESGVTGAELPSVEVTQREKEPFNAVMFEEVDIVLLLKVGLSHPIPRREKKSVRFERAMRRRHFQYRGCDPDRRESKEPNVSSFEQGNYSFIFFKLQVKLIFELFDVDDWIFPFLNPTQG